MIRQQTQRTGKLSRQKHNKNTKSILTSTT